MRKSIKYSQNFLIDPNLVKKIIKLSNIATSDIVYEIGAGKGIITQELSQLAKNVISFELDENFYKKLVAKFRGNSVIQIVHGDFLASDPPKQSFKVFSNIPFNITSQVIKKLTFEDNAPEESYLIVQKEAAFKFAGVPFDRKNDQVAVLLHPWFEFNVLYKFKPQDFFPIPKVSIILLKIKKRHYSLIDIKHRPLYQDFVVHEFKHKKNRSNVDFKSWILLFNSFLKQSESKQKIVVGSYKKLLLEQRKLKKINRTRIDVNWRRFK